MWPWAATGLLQGDLLPADKLHGAVEAGDAAVIRFSEPENAAGQTCCGPALYEKDFSVLEMKYLPVLEQSCGLGVDVCRHADPAGLEGRGETVLDGLARGNLVLAVLEPLTVTGRVDLNGEDHVARGCMGQSHVTPVEESDEEWVRRLSGPDRGPTERTAMADGPSLPFVRHMAEVVICPFIFEPSTATDRVSCRLMKFLSEGIVYVSMTATSLPGPIASGHWTVSRPEPVCPVSRYIHSSEEFAR